jgi:Lrp/AsnC family leucine-responsive transcriptional regulator
MILGEHTGLDDMDVKILAQIQEDCRLSLARIGDAVGLSAPSVLERIKKLEAAGVIQAFRAVLDGQQVGLDVTAFIGVSASARRIDRIEGKIGSFDGVLECHHVTGSYTLLVKVKTTNTSTLESLIRQIRSLDGVNRTETLVVLSTHTERTQLPLPAIAPSPNGRRARRHRATNAPSQGDHGNE